MALFANGMGTADDLGHGIGFVEGLGTGKAQHVFAPAFGLHHALAATGGVHERLRVKDAFQAALKAGLGHAVEQVPGGADVHALALELGRHVIEEGGQVLGHLGLQLVERLFLFQQFRADHQAIEGALGLCRAQLGAQMQHVGAEGGRVRRMEVRFVGQ
ncbi:hypothetical protein D3C73_1266150 [compost metagenome]